MLSLFVRRKSIHIFAALWKSANHENTGFANHKSAKCHIRGRSANRTNYLGPQICGFAICGTYLRTVHLWYSYVRALFLWLLFYYYLAVNRFFIELHWKNAHFLIQMRIAIINCSSSPFLAGSCSLFGLLRRVMTPCFI